jgi:hypothetical protein
LVLLKVRVAIDRYTLGIFERVKVWRNVDVQEFSIDEQEPFCIREARKLRKIVRLDLREPGRTNLRHPRSFIQRKISRAPRFLKFFTEPFYRHDAKCRLNGSVEIDQNLARFGAFAGT